MVESPQDNRIIAEHVKAMRPQVCELIDTLFKEISNPERIAGATYTQLISGMQMLLKGFEEEERERPEPGILSDILDNFKIV